MTDQELVPEQPQPLGMPQRGHAGIANYQARQVNDLDDFDVLGALRQVMASIRSHKILILLCGLVTAALMQTYFHLYPPIFEAKVTVLAESDKDSVREDFYKLWATFRKNDMDSDVELATSFPIVRKVVEKLDLKYDDVYHPPLDHTLYIWEQCWIGKKYRAIKEWFFPKEFDPYGLSPELKELARTVSNFKEGAALKPVPGSEVGYLSVLGPSTRVAEYANTLIDVFIEDRRQKFAEEAREALEALTREVKKAQDSFETAQRRIQEFETRNALMLGFAKEEVVMGHWVELGLGIDKLKALIASQEKSMQVVTAELGNEPDDEDLSSTEQASDVKNQMRARLFELQNTLSQQRSRVHEDSPEIREIKALIADTNAAIAAEPDKRNQTSTRAKNPNRLRLRQTQQDLAKTIAGEKAELAVKEETYSRIGTQLAALPSLKSENAVLSQDLNTSGQRMKLLRERAMMAEVSLATAESAPSTLKVVEYALPPSKANWPKKKLFMLVAILTGLIAGVGIALLMDVVSNLATRDRLAVRVDLPVFGTIDMDDYSGTRPLPGPGRRRAIDTLKDL